MKKIKENKGITLIALIITIIVMLILVGVTVSVVLNGGLFDTTKRAASSTQKEAEREILQAGIVVAMDKELKIPDAETLKSNLPSGWEITGTGQYTCTSPNKNVFIVGEDGTITEPDENFILIYKYFMGKDLMSLAYDDEEDGVKFIDDADSIPDAESSVSFVPVPAMDELLGDHYEFMYIVEYKGDLYGIIYFWEFDEETLEETKSVKGILVYKQKGREGKKAIYSYDGKEENEKEWLIIRDDGEYIEIVCPEIIGSLTLGLNDSKAQGNTDTEKAIDSYNKSIDTINQYCEDLIKNPNKKSVRSLGSNPNNSSNENSKKYTNDYSEMFQNYYNQYTIESGDSNYRDDLLRLTYYNKIPFEDECWLASRPEPDMNMDGSISVYSLGTYMNSSGWVYRTHLMSCSPTTSPYLNSINSPTLGVCPVVKVRADSVEIVD